MDAINLAAAMAAHKEWLESGGDRGQRADLSGAVLSGADLSGADLSGADLSPIRADLRSVLDVVPLEVPALRAAIVEGRVDGSVYQGSCACLVGTIANARGCDFGSIPGLVPSAHRPAERWFLAIRPGDTPERSQIAAITLQWVDEWLAEHSAPAEPSAQTESQT
ncbi:MAG TPA: pentapeptide repeat-containing protein [bacterium]|nr:pentapeptide repeat-containing protein [bacterium]